MVRQDRLESLLLKDKSSEEIAEIRAEVNFIHELTGPLRDNVIAAHEGVKSKASGENATFDGNEYMEMSEEPADFGRDPLTRN